jgi:hypothetical protein
VVLYYALGGGLGHLTRAALVLDAFGLADQATLLTASCFARDVRVTRGVPVLAVPERLGHDRAAYRAWLSGQFARLAPAELIVDSFPGGILGELCGVDLPPARHIARRLRWCAYARRLDGPLPRYAMSYTIEPLLEDHALRLAECSEMVTNLELGPRAASAEPLVDRAHWLVVHSGPDAETVDLVRYATELQAAEGATDAVMVVITPERPSWLPPAALWRDVYPAAPHFTHAERIITAAGWSAMRDAEPFRERHRFVPYPRALDDQFARAAAARSAGS